MTWEVSTDRLLLRKAESSHIAFNTSVKAVAAKNLQCLFTNRALDPPNTSVPQPRTPQKQWLEGIFSENRALEMLNLQKPIQHYRC